jgi:alpha-D-xyloside xylohydrolase
LPPAWAFGPWISANGWNSDREVEAQLEAMQMYDYPATVIVLEAWSDERTFYTWNDEMHFRDPSALIRKLKAAGLRVVLWQIPVIKYEWDGEPGAALLADEAEAIEKGYCVMRADGTPYRITEKWFHNSLVLDFTNPKATEWWFKKREHLIEMGVEGFKTDGGEFLFGSDLTLYNGIKGEAAHNLYPNFYVKAYQAFMKEKGINGVTFSRAGFAGSQAVPIHWAGDQLSSFSELRAQLNAGISAGLSGILFWGFDIGGFAGPLPGAELYLRATAMAAFCPIMQWHAEPRSGQYGGRAGENNDRSPWNLARVHDDPSILEIAAAFARMRMELMPYIWSEAQYAAEHSRPLMAHLIYDFPDDPTVYGISDQYMLGRELLVAPIVHEGMRARRVYIPAGNWFDFFDGLPVEGGQWIEADCPLSGIPVFRRGGI